MGGQIHKTALRQNTPVYGHVMSLLRGMMLNMSSATLTFAQTDHCDITETILCCWEVANPSKTKGENSATVACERYLEYSYLHEETISPDHHEGTKSATPYDQYAGRANNINFIFMRDQNSPPPLNNTLIAGHQLRANVQVAANNFKHVKMSKQGHKIRPLQYQRCHVQNPMKMFKQFKHMDPSFNRVQTV